MKNVRFCLFLCIVSVKESSMNVELERRRINKYFHDIKFYLLNCNMGLL